MAYWRMRIRAGRGGEDLWPLCIKYDLAAITYEGVHDVDLTPYSEVEAADVPGWDMVGKGSSKRSLRYFAWNIRGGDTIFVARKGQIVGMGHPRVSVGERAYRFNANSPIVTENGDIWRHLIDMDWDDSFNPFKPESWRAPLDTVLKLFPGEVEAYLVSAQVTGHRNHIPTPTDEEVSKALLIDDAYSCYSPAAMRLIRREHASMSNLFRTWMQREHQINVDQEIQQIDALFTFKNRNFLVEFKIAYHENTKRAIREAIGQILEYNYYPPRSKRDHWLLILNRKPGKEDIQFLRILRDALHIPLAIGWLDGVDFRFNPPFPFA